ncbi:MAG: CpaF family protein [Acidimicrobiia bacterium]|nr:CpaF family protein [Acidimicrobiia bacterium]
MNERLTTINHDDKSLKIPVNINIVENTEIDMYDRLRHSVMIIADKSRLDPIHNQNELLEVIKNVVNQEISNNAIAGISSIIDFETTTNRLSNSIFGYGPLHSLLARNDIEEIFIEGERVSYIDSSGFLRGLNEPTTASENRHIIERLLSDTDRTLTVKAPLTQARVLNGTARLTASIPPVSDKLSATLRKYIVKNISLHDLTKRNALSEESAGFLHALMQTRSRIVISGEPGAGKTTLLSSMLSSAPPQHCIRCCEEIREIAVNFTHGGYYEVRPQGIDGTGEISLRDLVKFSLAMRPDRIVCGEVRGAEAFELSRAVNSGCGFACTVHSNNAVEGLEALVNASLMAGENVSENIMRKIFSSAIDVVVHVDREENASISDGLMRGVTEIIAVESSISDSFTTTTLFSRKTLQEQLKFSGTIPDRLISRIEKSLPSEVTLNKICTGEIKYLQSRYS